MSVELRARGAWRNRVVFRTLMRRAFYIGSINWPSQLSKRVQKVKPSPTLAVTARAAKLKAEGKDIIGLGAGEPDFDTPLHIADAGVEAIRSGITRYTAVDGTAELKDAIIAKFKRENGLTYERSQILVSSGAKQTCFNLCAALLDPGDECVIPAPYWVSYPDMVLLADGVPVIVNGGAEQGYKITPAQLDAAITPRTKLFILNSPSNPTGAAYTQAELQGARRGPRQASAGDHRRGRDVRAHLLGSRALAELRAGEPAALCAHRHHQRRLQGVCHDRLAHRLSAAAPRTSSSAMSTIQGQSTSNASSISQRAATVALNGDQACVAEMNKAFKERHDFVVAGLNAIPGISLPDPAPVPSMRSPTCTAPCATSASRTTTPSPSISWWRPVWPWCRAPDSARLATCGSRSPAA